MFSCKCKKCGSNIAIDSQGVLQCKGCGRKIIDSSLVNVKKHNPCADCPNCNGELRKHSSGDIMICDYCDSVFILETYFKRFKNQFDTILLFQNDTKEEILNRFYTACTREFAPRKFRNDAKINEVNNVYIPFYQFDVKCKVHYSLQIGHKKTRQKYNSTTHRYDTEHYTDWVNRTGSFTETYRIISNGFSPSIDSIGNSHLLDDSENQKEFRKMCDLICDNPSSFSDSKSYSPFLLDNHEVVKPTSDSNAWTAQGSQKLDYAITRSIKKLFSESTRNIKFNRDILTQTSICRLYPLSFVSYSYNQMQNKMVVLDGIDGGLYRGKIPLSAHRLIKNISRWLVPIGIIAICYFLYNAYDSVFLLLLGLILGVVVWLWLGKIQGTGGDISSEMHLLNKQANQKFGIISAILVVVMLIVGANSMTERTPPREIYQETYRSTTSYSTEKTQTFVYTTKAEQTDSPPLDEQNVFEELKLIQGSVGISQWVDAEEIMNGYVNCFGFNINNFTLIGYGTLAEIDEPISGFIYITKNYCDTNSGEKNYYLVDIKSKSIYYCIVDSDMFIVWQNGQPYTEDYEEDGF